MIQLGTYNRDIYYLSWMTQRLANRAPDWTFARKWSWSTTQQLLNPIGKELEATNRQLVEERDNIFISSADINLIDRIYTLELTPGMDFTTTESTDGILTYQPPTVYGTLSGTEYTLTMAEYNNIESFWYTCLPSRIEYNGSSLDYNEIIPRVEISNLSEITPGTLPVEGFIYITIRGNSTWQYEGRQRIYFPKVFIRGVTRKGTSLEEAVPIRYNGTFKTINQWESVESVFVSYMDDDAYITVEVLPFDQETQLDTKNLIIKDSGDESWRFVRLIDKTWGSSLVSEGFTTSSLDVVRLGIDTLDYEYHIELTDDNGDNVDLLAATIKPNTDYLFAVDDTNFYVYNTKLPYPDVRLITNESPDTKMDLWSDRWVYSRLDTAEINTRILDVTIIPYKFRWTLEEPNGNQWYLGVDGSKWPTTTSAWIENRRWDDGSWDEQLMQVYIEQTGEYILTLECFYTDSAEQGKDYIFTTKFLIYVPVISPEVTIALPEELEDSNGIMFDSDGKLWLLIDDELFGADVFYDYFIADYERKRILLRENYSSVRVVV